jgi:predicted phage tail protein
MNALPTPPRPTMTDGQPRPSLLDATVAAAVEHSIERARQDGTSPQVVIGTTPPVPQPDSRIVPTWATGIAVASIGVGAGSVALGCAVWLAMKGLSSVSVPALQQFAWIVIAPFAGLAMVLTAGAAAISKAKKAEPREVHNHNNGPVYQDNSTTETNTKNVALVTRNDHNPKEKK